MLGMSLRQGRDLKLKSLHYHRGFRSCEGLLDFHALGTQHSGACLKLPRVHSLELFNLVKGLGLLPLPEVCGGLVYILVEGVATEEAEAAP